MKIKHNRLITVVCNDTGKEVTGRIQKYTPDEIVISQTKIIKFDAKKVHFKMNDKQIAKEEGR